MGYEAREVARAQMAGSRGNHDKEFGFQSEGEGEGSKDLNLESNLTCI